MMTQKIQQRLPPCLGSKPTVDPIQGSVRSLYVYGHQVSDGGLTQCADKAMGGEGAR